MSLKLSGDAKEVLCGTKGAHLLVYDLIANRMVNKVDGCHTDEINSVCFANRQHSNIIFSGSDDGMVKVWDRRALSSNRPAGVFVGHAEGITNVASKGDGIYLASNGKDQLLKVWDIRQAVAYDRFRDMTLPRQDPGFDYRYGARYRMLDRQPKHFEDKSVFTFKGHAVYSTLIRCQFSPLETTGQRYVYTGSSDGNLHIYDLVTGDTAGVLKKQAPARRDDNYGYGNASPARDISWHPFMPILASTEFNGKVNIWSMQNIGEEEKQKIAAQEAAQKERQDTEVNEDVDSEEEEEEEDSNDPMARLFGGSNQTVMVRGANGQTFRVPVSMLRQLMRQQQEEEEAEVEADESVEDEEEKESESVSVPEESKDAKELEEEVERSSFFDKKKGASSSDDNDWDMEDLDAGDKGYLAFNDNVDDDDADAGKEKPKEKDGEDADDEDESPEKLASEEASASNNDESSSAVFNGVDVTAELVGDDVQA